MKRNAHPWWLSGGAVAFRDWFMRLLLLPLVRRYARPLRVIGLENLVANAPLIFAANHASHADAALVLAALPRAQRRRLVIAMAADVMDDRPLESGILSLLLGAMPMERRRTSIAGLRLATDVLRAGWSFLIFPEGRLSQSQGIDTFKPGVGLLAATAGVAVVPVLIEGGRDVLPVERHWPRRAPASVSFLTPVPYAGQSYEALAGDVEQKLRQHLRRSIDATE